MFCFSFDLVYVLSELIWCSYTLIIWVAFARCCLGFIGWFVAYLDVLAVSYDYALREIV